MMIGVFMIIVDSTIVAVANPSIMTSLHTDYGTVIWVTSAYFLACAVPLLVAGRLGDRFGPKTLYLSGLAVFTAASAWCGLSGSIGMLIVARTVQGIGAALLAPQVMSMITQILPPQRRGAAMSLWGATVGFASLVGPLAGGVLIGGLGWESVFFVNIPLGIIGLALAARLLPVLPIRSQRFDFVGVGFSGLGMFLVVFALQEAQPAGWAAWIWLMLVGGVALMGMFAYWQAVNSRESLIPLEIFRERNFCMCTIGAAVVGFVTTSMMLPVMFYAQMVRGLSPLRSAMLIAPLVIVNVVLAPIVGKVVDRSHPRAVIGFGFSVLAIALFWLSTAMSVATPIWLLVLPSSAIGVGAAFTVAPVAATATRNLPPQLAGASSSVYNTARYLGSVLGTAGMAALMTWRISAEIPTMSGGTRSPAAEGGTGGALRLPQFVREPFSAAMSESMLLPAFVALLGIGAALLMIGANTPRGEHAQGGPVCDTNAGERG